MPSLAMPKGDRAAACVAAASVVAKVTRDRLMVRLHERYPTYGFDMHKGYVTREHSAALALHGPCPEHRFSFVTVSRLGTATGEIAEIPAGMAGEEMLDNEDNAFAQIDADLEGAAEQVGIA
jgi:ribonuclease HII